MADSIEEKFDKFVSTLLKNHWHLFAFAGVFILALYIRLLSLPLVQKYLPDIDTYLFFRLSDYLLNHDFHMMLWDTFRNYPFGISTATEQPLPYYLPALFYKFAGIFTNAPYLDIVKYYSPIIAALTAIPMYLIGKELKDKWTGIFSAFFFAVMPAILMRNPAGYIEKEPATLVFMMSAVYFFIRTLKKDSWLSAVLMGIFLLFVDIGWGGVKHLYLAFAVFGFVMLLMNKYSPALLKNYSLIPLAVIGGAYITNSGYLDSEHLILFGIFGLALVRDIAGRFKLLPENQIKYLPAALTAGGVILVVVGSFIIPAFANLLAQASQLLFYQESTFGGTVAENQRPDLNSFLAQLGTPYGASVLPFLGSYIIYLSAWILAFGAIILLIYQLNEKGSKFRWIGVLSSIIAFAAFLRFLQSSSGTLQNIFILSAFVTLLVLARRSQIGLLMGTFLFAAMLGFFGVIRVGFLLGPYIAILAAYTLSEAVSYIQNMDAVRNAKTLEEKINLYSVGGGVLVALILIANLAAGYAIGSSMGPNFSDNWNGAMNFMKYNTSGDSVIISWWDFGYWFQTASGRATMLDGGNNDIYGDKMTGMYFSSRMNETEEKEFLESRGITHILVDYSMIGKFPAMTRIGTDWQEIDSYVQLGEPQQIQKNGKTIMVFQLGPSAFYVPLTQSGGIGGNIIFSTPQGDANLKYLCTENGLIDLNASEPSMDACLLVTKYGVFFPIDATHGKPSTLTGTSVFSKLFFFDGKGIDYVKKVYDNPEIKIYEVELPRKTREELLKYWENNKDKGGGFPSSRLNALKEASLCAKENEIVAC